VPVRFCPQKDTLAILNSKEWIASYSGGKDSTSVVTWIEWLRRIGMVKATVKPRLVMSDTEVEYPFLQDISERMITALKGHGWHCEIVSPRIHEKLYNRIFGIGNVPVHPGNRKTMRWCTRSTKIDPMNRFAKTIGAEVIQLSGVRYGESAIRDGKLKVSGCAAGGECGLPPPRDDVHGPIINWKTCQVIEWLNGEAGEEVNAVIADLLPLMADLIGVYNVKSSGEGWFGTPPKVTALRFGCIGCPAITRSRVIAGKDKRWVHLRRIWAMWEQLYKRVNRCCWIKTDAERRGKNWPDFQSGQIGFGPLKMAVRQQYFAELLDIQQQAGITLVTPEDIAFIHRCWAEKRYPRGWSEADELTMPPEEGLFAEAPG